MTRLYQQDLFYTSFPPYMACSDDFGNVVHLPKDDALEKPYIAPNNKAFINCLLFDIDRPEAGAAWIDADLPQPNWTVQNPNNGHVHLGYWLKTPVSRTLASRATPQRYLARIQHATTMRLGADTAYGHFLTKTPYHDKWRTIKGIVVPYDLDELRKPLNEDLPLRLVRSEAVGEGRNVTMFDGLRSWAYRERLKHNQYDTWLSACLKYAEALNLFVCPLPYSEVKSTATSVAKWTWRNINIEEFKRIQRNRRQLRTIKFQERMIDIQAGLLC